MAVSQTLASTDAIYHKYISPFNLTICSAHLVHSEVLKLIEENWLFSSAKAKSSKT